MLYSVMVVGTYVRALGTRVLLIVTVFSLLNYLLCVNVSVIIEISIMNVVAIMSLRLRQGQTFIIKETNKSSVILCLNV